MVHFPVLPGAGGVISLGMRLDKLSLENIIDIALCCLCLCAG
jgi:hypothetical protein